MTQCLTVENVSVRYGSQYALKNISLSAATGEFIAIVGKSGSGKTTFLHALARFVASEGVIAFSGTVGMIFQQYVMFPWLTVAENIEFGLDNKSAAEKQAIVRAHLELAQLNDKKDKYPGELSGGQVQRAALARCLATDPDMLLMDEPYGALDEHTKEKMQEWLLAIWTSHKKTVIFVTHNIEEAIFLADRVLVLDEGVFTKEIAIPFARPRNTEIKFTTEFSELRKEVSRCLNKKSVT